MPAVTGIQLGEITADVALKDIKNVHLSVYPPSGRVKISAPSRMSLDTTHNSRFVALIEQLIPKWQFSGYAKPSAGAPWNLGSLILQPG